MMRLRFLCAAAGLSALVASPASAQHMIDEPGMFAFVHPNGDLGLGMSRPIPDARAQASIRMEHRPVVVKRPKVAK